MNEIKHKDFYKGGSIVVFIHEATNEMASFAYFENGIWRWMYFDLEVPNGIELEENTNPFFHSNLPEAQIIFQFYRNNAVLYPAASNTLARQLDFVYDMLQQRNRGEHLGNDLGILS
jgi:hypothetical protein